MPGGTRQASANRLKRTISGVPSVTYHLNPTFAAVVLAASLLASSNFALAADAVSSASKVPAATADAPALEGVRTMAAKGGDKLPDNVDAVTSASVSFFLFMVSSVMRFPKHDGDGDEWRILARRLG